MEDQLRASEGWVRCGHCRQIFDALERLFQLEESAAPPSSSSASTSNPAVPPPTVSQNAAQASSSLIEQDVAWAETRPAMFGEEHLLMPSGFDSGPTTTSPPPVAEPAEESHVPAEVSLAEALGGEVPAPVEAAEQPAISAPVHAADEQSSPDHPAEPATATNLTFLATPDASSAQELEEPDSGPNTQPIPLPFVDTAAGDDSTLPAAAEDHTESSTLFLIEDVGADKEAEAARAKELIQELEPSRALQQRQSLRGSDAEEAEPTSVPADFARSTSAGELSSSRSGNRSGSSRRRTSSSAGRGSSTSQSSDERSVPAFVRRADSKARWQRPWVRVALALTAIGGALALSAQAAIQWHDLIGARAPALKPLVQDLCLNTTGCVVEPPRLIDAVVVESSALTRPSEQIGYRLNVLIHNRLEHDIAPPHLELTLTDISGAVLVRRVLTPADFGVTQNALEPQSESAWQLDFHYDTPAISGYTVRAFYP